MKLRLIMSLFALPLLPSPDANVPGNFIDITSACGINFRHIAKTGTQYEKVSTASSYRSSSDRRVHFGLGANAVVNSLKIIWPRGHRADVE